MRDEFWIECPTEELRVGDLMPGRCVYRQTLAVADNLSVYINREWLAPELAPTDGSPGQRLTATP